MTANASVSLSGDVTGASSGSKKLLATITSAAASMHTQSIKLANGFNAISVPTDPATTGVLIKLPADNTLAVVLKGITGDTGIAIGKTGFVVLTWDSTAAPTTFGLTAAGAHSAATEISFF